MDLIRRNPSELLARLALVMLAAGAAFGLVELAARLWLVHLARPDRFAAYASLRQLEARPARGRRLVPHRYLGYVTTPGFRRGVNFHDERGFRGAEVPVDKPEGRFRIACLGGSTTYGVSVEDPADAYPAQLERYLRADGHDVEVVNAGVPGYGTLESLINLELRVLELDPDLILVQHAVNDLQTRFAWPPRAPGEPFGTREDAAPSLQPSWYEHSTVVRTLLVRSGRLVSHGSIERALGRRPGSGLNAIFHAQLLDGTYPAGPFAEVSMAERLAANPPVDFERRLRSLVVLARGHGLEVILASFPYHPGWTGRSPIAVPEYRAGIDEANQSTLRVAAETGAIGFDLASRIPPETAYFSDGYHLTREGNALRARILGQLIVERGLVVGGPEAQ